jgi:hypothetical protein
MILFFSCNTIEVEWCIEVEDDHEHYQKSVDDLLLNIDRIMQEDLLD